MATYIGGDVLSVTCNHPTLGSFNFKTKSDNDYDMDPGGNRSADDVNGITPDGQMIDKVNRVRWSFSGVLMADFISNQEIENLPLLSGSPEQGTWTIVLISGAVYKGKGKPVGDITVGTNNSEATVKISGGGNLEKL